MKQSLFRTLTLAFLLVAITAAGLMAISLRLTSPERFSRLILEQSRSDFKSLLIEYFTANGSWDGVQGYIRQLQPKGGMPMGMMQPDRLFIYGLIDTNGSVIIPLAAGHMSGSAGGSPAIQTSSEPVEVNGKTVGYILTPARAFELRPEEQNYLRRMNEALLLAALGSVLVALVVGLLLAQRLTQPLRALTGAVQRMHSGELEQEVKVTSQDEIGRLAQAFNQLSRQLAQSIRLRRQMTADIAHDLRTPLTVIAGYIEAMQQGVLKPTPERLALIYADVEHLQRLVEDLRLLSLADSGELPLYRQQVQPGTLLQQALTMYQQQAEKTGITLHLKIEENLPAIQVDADRMIQVFGNLITNALRYTPSGGSITLSAVRQQGDVLYSVADTGSGIPPEEIPLVFDRFYRADASRHDDDNSGLGLAIVKSLVEAHGGKVWAESSPDRGTTIYIILPGL